ncbi:hypothetical protein DM806_01135 [Sphingobium lactosutens]|uniref:alpha/beta hydrolase family protein n=1 Tax=Sphingobium lactosutens TaxID=522773 RepID=UPI0015BF298B|nr:hypothetical protein [Sphingobium lactosutens]NWK94316.1 hypothetical protein [Sphingobium lactosutens]
MKNDSTNDQTAPLADLPSVSRRTVAGGFAALVASLAGAGVSQAATGNMIGKPYRPAMLGTDYATTDSVYFDPDYPSMHFPHIFKSKGKTVQSFMWLADGPGAKGCVILSPQRYGGDCLDSIIPALVGAGIHVMRFNPRGMWDDKEVYSFTSALDDLHAAVAFLGENGGQHAVPPGTGAERTFQIDLDHIAVLGKSGGGGMMGWVAGSENPGLNTIITVSPNELLAKPLSAAYTKYFNELRDSLDGRVDIVKELDALTPADYNRFSMTKAAPRLVNKNVLLIGHSSREYVDTLHMPLVQAMQKANAKHFSQVIFEANDYYLTARVALARLVVSWLKEECGF